MASPNKTTSNPIITEKKNSRPRNFRNVNPNAAYAANRRGRTVAGIVTAKEEIKLTPNLFSVKTFFVLAIALLCSMQVMAQKKYSEKELAAMKQKLYTSVASHAKDVQVMVDKVFSFGELGFQEFETSAYLTSVLEKNGFKVEKNIPRCVAINLKPQSDDNSFNLLQLLKKTYGHFEMGIYLTALKDGEINVGNTINS